MKSEPKIETCCGLKPHIIGDGIKPSYGTTIQCQDWQGCGNHIFVPNMKGTGGTRLPAIDQWNNRMVGGIM